MYKRIEIIKFSEDGLNKYIWTFYYLDSDHSFVLDDYSEYERKSNRGQYPLKYSYRRIDSRMNTISLEDVPFPTWLYDEVIQEFIKDLKVKKGFE